jgi:hypothetical protein
MIKLLFYCWIANRGLKLSRKLRTPEDGHLLIYTVLGLIDYTVTRIFYVLLIAESVTLRLSLPAKPIDYRCADALEYTDC